MLPTFQLEHYLGLHEHKATISLCSSGLESMGLEELLALADAKGLALWEQLRLGYSQPQGLPALRHEISRQYACLSPEQVAVFSGAAEGILCTLSGMLDRADHTVVIRPCYQSLESIPASRCQVSAVELDETNRWQLDAERVVAAIRPNTKIIVFNFPNNPTGALPNWDTMDALIQIARQRGIYLFSDEVYRLMEIDPATRLPAIADCYERGISVSSMSKPYGLPGLRIGWVATQAPEVLQATSGIKHYASICPNSASEVLAFMALRAKEQILQRNQAIMTANLSVMDSFFKAQALFEWTAPLGGCIGFPKLLTGEAIDRFALRLLEEEQVLILPGTLYGNPNNRFRISFGQKTMKEGLTRFEHFIRKRQPAL